MNMFKDKNVKAIIPSRGGVGVAGILPYLDYNVIKNNLTELEKQGLVSCTIHNDKEYYQTES